MSFLRNKEYRPSIAADTVITLDLRGVAWQFAGDSGRRRQDLGDEVSGELIKQNVKRKVVRVDDLFFKQSTYHGAKQLLNRLRGGAARREAAICRHLETLGIPVPQVVGVGEERSGPLLRRDLLVTAAVLDGLNLDAFLEAGYSAIPNTQKRTLVRDFALFIKKLHEEGVMHADLHLGNILLVASRDRDRFVLLDVDKIRCKGRPLSRSEEVGSLAMLLNSVRAWTSRQEQFRFLKVYCGLGGQSLKRFVEDIRAQHLKQAMRVWVKKAGRCLQTNSRFVAGHYREWRLWRKREGMSDKTLQALLNDPDGFLQRGRMVKAGNTVSAGVITLDGHEYFLKRYNVKGAWYRLRNAVRRSRAVRTWQHFWAFHVRNLPVPVPIACFEQRDFRLLGKSYILSEYIADAAPLNEVWSKYNLQQKRSVLIRIGLLISEIHRTGYLHGDLKWNNFLVADGGTRIVIVDLDGCRLMKRFLFEAGRKDLQRFLRDLQTKESDETYAKLLLDVWSKRLC